MTNVGSRRSNPPGTWDGLYGDTLSGIQNAIGSVYNDIMFGNDQDNVFDGDGGSDQIYGGGGRDTISFARASGPQVINLAKQETWDYGASGDKLSSIENAVGSRFNDLIYGDDQDNVFDGSGGSDTIYGGGGTDTISFATATGRQVIDLLAQKTWDYGANGDTISSIENAIGSNYNDVIYGNDQDNVIDGHGGSDTINGGGGNDTISFASAAGRQVIDLANRKTWDYGTNGDTLERIENVIGTRYNDVIFGDIQDNIFDGYGGSDSIYGNGGSDTISFIGATGPQVIDLANQKTWITAPTGIRSAASRMPSVPATTTLSMEMSRIM